MSVYTTHIWYIYIYVICIQKALKHKNHISYHIYHKFDLILKYVIHVKTYKIYEFVVVGSKFLQHALHITSTYNLFSTPPSNYFNDFF